MPCLQRHVQSPLEKELSDQTLYSDSETQEQHKDTSRGTAPQGGLPSLPFPLFSPSSLPHVLCPFLPLSGCLGLSLTLTPYTPMQSGREALTTGSQRVHPEAPKNFLALTLVTKAMQFLGGGGAQCRLAHRKTRHGRIIIIIIITISYIQDKPSCPKPTAQSKSLGTWRGCLPAPTGLTQTIYWKRGQPLLLLPAEAWHVVGRLALPMPPLRAGHTCTGG